MIGRSVSVVSAISWDDHKKGRIASIGLAIALLLSLPLGASSQTAARAEADRLVSVIIRMLPGSDGGPEQTVEDIGGRVGRHIDIIDGFIADVPIGQLDVLRAERGIHSVTVDRRVQMLHAVDGYNPASDPGSMFKTLSALKVDSYWKTGFTGKGVDVALIDTGVAPVAGLSAPGKVVNGADLSFESEINELRYLDTYGHGTYLAGIIAGNDGGSASISDENHDTFLGVAPDARIVNVKVANAMGATDVSQVIAAIDWVVQHRFDNGLNIRVLNLSFGTDGIQDYRTDPLAFAVEVAWQRGIVVVAAAGNSGYGTPKLNNPAYDPFVIAVGANDTGGTTPTNDDVIPEWSSRGDGTRNPDVVAPGKSIVSLRVPGSQVDLTHPEGRLNSRFFKGSGTSQAAASVSGVAALIVQQRPAISPDQVKALLMGTAERLPAADPVAQGAGLVNLKDAAKAPTPASTQTWPLSTGTGSLEAARGSAHVMSPDGLVLTGEMDVFGAPWNGNSWSGNSWSGNSWSGGSWSGNSWSGNSWSGGTWNGNSWSGNSWSGNSWSGNSWSGNSWSGNSWSGNSWSGNSWSGNSWSGNSWSGNSWSGNSWSGNSWS